MSEQWIEVFDAGEVVGGFLKVAGYNAQWKPIPSPKPGEGVSMTCLTCGHVVTMRSGDEPIPFGDQRLCEHARRRP